MANTTLVTGKFVQITGLNADWVWGTDIASRLANRRVRSIQFAPSTIGDILRVRNATVTGATVFYAKCAAVTDHLVKYYGQSAGCQPCIKISECTLGTAANAIVLIELE